MKTIEFTLNIEATTSQNSRLHWAKKADIAKAEKNKASLGLRAAKGFLDIEPLFRVTLTRVGPRRMDDDNARGTLKAIRDGIAARLRIDDGSPLVEWVVKQETGPYAVRVRVERLPFCCGEMPFGCENCAPHHAEPFDADDHSGRKAGGR